MFAQAGIRSSSKTRRIPRLAGCVGMSLALAGAVIGVSAGAASAADSNPMTTQANAVVTSGITLTALTPSFTLTGAPGATVQSGNVDYNVETNNAAGYTVKVTSTTATMAPVGTSQDNIAIGVLTVREAAGAYTAMNAVAGVTVHTQGTRSANAGDNLSTNYQMRIPTVTADTYRATLTYLATTQ